MGKFKRKKIDNEVERRLAIGLIVSSRVIREVQSIYNADFVEIPYVRKIADWCFKYFKKYEKAPGKEIQSIFNSAVRKGMDEDTSEMIEDFLEEISDEYERAKKFNAQYLLDEIEERFKTKSLSNLYEDSMAELSNGNVDEAEGLLSRYKRVARPSSTGINPWNDQEAVFDAFETAVEPLFTFPGAFGRFVNKQILRGRLIGLMGRAKIGKSWQLMEWVYRASRARCNVAFFQVGDMDQNAMTIRLHIRLSGRSNLPEYCKEMWVPVLDCQRNQEDTCKLKYRESPCGLDDAEDPKETPDDYVSCCACQRRSPHRFRGTVWYERAEATKPLTWRHAVKRGKKFMNRLKGKFFKLITYPNGTINVQGIATQLDNWQHFDGFVPDVIVIDYADILDAEPGYGKKETREKQDATWRALRRLSQEKHALVVTATQSDAASYDAKVLKMKHFSENRTKYDHVSGMLALNQTPDEKDEGIMRIGWLMLRNGDYDPREMITVLQCLQKGNCHIGSYKPRKKKKKKEESDE